MKYSLVVMLLLSVVMTAQAEPPKLLIYTDSTDRYHGKLTDATRPAFDGMAKQKGFAFDWTEDPSTFTKGKLSEYDVIVFLCINCRNLSDQGRTALKQYVNQGGGIVGVHTAASEVEGERRWPWWEQLIGRVSAGHPPQAEAKMRVVDKQFPATAHLPDPWVWFEEWFFFGEPRSEGLKVVLTVDDTTYDTRRFNMGEHHPIAWYQTFDGGRCFYTALGHVTDAYLDPLFLEHLYGGIRWAATGETQVPAPEDTAPRRKQEQVLANHSLSQIPQRQKFDFGWKFNRGFPQGVEATGFDDSSWEEVDLPHDWSIEGPFSKENPSYHRGAWLPAGKGIYRKRFEVPESMKDQRTVIYFDGAYRNSEVWINGHLMGKRPFGYVAFYYDLTDHLAFGAKNTLVVKLDNSPQPGSRWYSGSGIYRHVWLITTGKLYVPVWGNYIVAKDYPLNESGKVTIQMETAIQNDHDTPMEFWIRHTAFDPDGKTAAKVMVKESIPAGGTRKSLTSLKVPNPRLWDTENPNLYTIRTDLIVGNETVYSESNHTGIRKLEFDAEKGFILNGEVVKLKGVCLHHDGGPLGAAIYRRTIERQLELLREMGCNAIRTAHNPYSEEFLVACDHMGFLVMNEMFDEWELAKRKPTFTIDYYAKIFDKWADRDLTDFVLRDRNHPSVIMWSIGNEIKQMHRESGAPIARRLAAIVHKLDYRPVTNGVRGYRQGVWPNEEAMAVSDIRGYNYILDEGFDKERKLAPEAMSVVTECSSAKSRDGKIDEEGIEAWRNVKKRPHVMGLFIWTGWDYMGEGSDWPARSHSGAPIDLCGFPQDSFYFYQSQWTDAPMVHIFPHWNLEGQEGKPVTVHAYTNCDEVELFQDGASLGKQTNNRAGVQYQSWEVTYRPGELKAVGFRDGKPMAEKRVATAGEAARLELFARRSTMEAGGQDLVYVECTVLDSDGNMVPEADNLVTFSLKGPATIAGVGNGNSMSHEPFKANYRKAFNGKCLAIVRSTKEHGLVRVTAGSDGLQGDTLGIK